MIKNYLSRFDFESLKIITNDSIQKREFVNADKFVIKSTQLKKYLKEKIKWIQIKQKKQINRNYYSISKFRVNNSMMLNAKFQIIIRSNKNLNYKNLNSFIVIRIIDNCAYKLKLLNVIQNTLSVFHFWLLHVDDDMFLQE